MIQIRGLLKDEYLYTHKDTTSYIKKCIYKMRAWQLNKLEKVVYSTTKQQKIRYTLQAVSPALKKHLKTQYGIGKTTITIANDDLPPLCNDAQVACWRTVLRAQHNIPSNASVYCYNGSAKPWQCPEKIIAFFITIYKKNTAAFLLILTQDSDIFTKLLTSTRIDNKCYKIISVTHNTIYQHLAMADIGLLFREQHLINWVSRPTKILEYRAVGLSIVHNNTVAWLTETSS
jgi:hypothetical protein